jgi:putative membrane protein
VRPAVAWLQFTAVLYVTHFSPLYELALENDGEHAMLHALYLGSAPLFWTPILAVAPAPHAPSHPVRLLALFLAIPMMAFLGFAFYVTNHAL